MARPHPPDSPSPRRVRGTQPPSTSPGAAGPLTFSHPRFTLLEMLGEGAMGTVFRARDHERGDEVALKLLVRVTPLGIYRFKHEFRSLAHLSHPNLLALYELLSTGSQWFFTSELILGTDLVSFVRGAAGGPVVDEPTERGVRTSLITAPGASGAVAAGDLAARTQVTLVSRPTPSLSNLQAQSGAGPAPGRPSGRYPAPLSPAADADLRSSFRQLAVGLHDLHRAGHLHRDVKPSNVLVTAEGRVVLVDFGVLVTLTAEDPFAHFTVGTPAYMAPEQAAGQVLDERADWYAVGVMLYELLTGRRPFVGPPEQVMAMRAQLDPRPVRELAPGAPDDLADLADALLARERAARPSGEEVLARLGGAPSSAASALSSNPSLTPRGEVMPLVGRQAELDVLDDLFGQVVATEGTRVALLRGPAGIGKTRVSETFVAHAAAHGAVTVSGRCRERESLPFKAIDAIVDALMPLLSDLPAEVLAEHAGALALLAPHFPVLASFPALAPLARGDAAAPLDPAKRRRQLPAALRELLLAVSFGAPLVLLLDDAHWGDADSAMLLAETLAPPWPGRLLVILVCRSEDERADFPRLLSRWVAIDAPVELGPLDAAESAEMARRMLRAAGNPEHLADRLVREAGGVPLLLGELARHAGDGAATDAPAGLPGEGGGLDALLADRLESLPPAARTLIETLAVAARPLPVPLAARAAGLDAVGQSHLVLLGNHRLLRVRRHGKSDLLETFHDRVRGLVTASMSAEALRAAHLRLALAFEVAGGEPDAVATHLEAAGERERAFPHAVAAADAAAAALAFDRAAGWYERALALGVAGADEERRLSIAWGRQLGYAGRGLDASRVLLRAAKLTSGVDASRLELEAAEQLLRCGYVDDSLSHLTRMLDLVGEKLRPFSVTGVLGYLGRRLYLRLRGWHTETRPVESIDPMLLFKLDVLWTAGSGFGYQNPFHGTDLVQRYCSLALATGEPLRAARSVAAYAFAAAVDDTGFGNQALVDRVRVARELGERHRDDFTLAIADVAEAMGHHQRGDFARVPALAAAGAKRLSERTVGTVWEIHLGDLISLWSLFYLGRAREAGAKAERLAREARERGDLQAEIDLDTGVPILRWLVADRPELADQARARLTPRLARYIDSPQPHWHVFVSEVLSALYQGEAERAIAACDRSAPMLRRTELHFVPMVRVELAWLRLLGLLASPAARARDAKILKEIRKGLRLLGRDRTLVAPALAKLGEGALARLESDDERALAAWQAAATRCDELTCAFHAAAARLRLAPLLGGAEGAALAAQARAVFAEQGVVDVERFLRLFVPAPHPA